MDHFKATDGRPLSLEQRADVLAIEHVLQRHRDVWTPIDEYPYLAIDIEQLEKHLASTSSFVVFTRNRLHQNLRPHEFGQRLLDSMTGSAVTGGFASPSDVFVEGMANPKASGLISLGEPLIVGAHPFAAMGTHYIYYHDREHIYQRRFAELVTVGTKSRPRCQHADFDLLAELQEGFYRDYINAPKGQAVDLVRLASLLDGMFAQNLKVHEAAERHHREREPNDQAFDYPAPLLTKYGRLVHDAAKTPRIEISYALLHYEKAIREFNAAKIAERQQDADATFFHGVYCVVGVAACIESVANNVVFAATSKHPDAKDKRTPLVKINESGMAIARQQGRQFVPLAKGQSAYDALDRVRVARNRFMHAKEVANDIDSSMQVSTEVAMVGVAACREYLLRLREAVADIYRQLPDHRPPIATGTIKWLGDLEIP